jgi:clan AA aspartic protease
MKAAAFRMDMQGVAMGLTVLKLEVANPANPEVAETVEFLIDSGALYSLIPRPVLQRLGINPLRVQTFRLANGHAIERQIGVALFKYQDRVGGATVIFGEEEDSTLLGAYTLESMGFSLDPIRRVLVSLPMTLA